MMIWTRTFRGVGTLRALIVSFICLLCEVLSVAPILSDCCGTVAWLEWKKSWFLVSYGLWLHIKELLHRLTNWMLAFMLLMTQTDTFTHPWLSIELLTCETLLLLILLPPCLSITLCFYLKSVQWGEQSEFVLILVYTRWKWNVGGFDPWHPASEAREEDREDSEQSKTRLCNHMHRE